MHVSDNNTHRSVSYVNIVCQARGSCWSIYYACTIFLLDIIRCVYYHGCLTGTKTRYAETILCYMWTSLTHWGRDKMAAIFQMIFPKVYEALDLTWWRHQMETYSALLAICAGNSPVTGEFPAQRPVMRGVDVFLDLRLIKRLSKQSWGWRFETPIMTSL